MEARGALAVIAVVAAFAAAACAASSALSWARRRQAGRLPSGTARDGVSAWLLRNGVPALAAPARFALGFSRFSRFARDAASVAGEAGFSTSPEVLATVMIALALAVGAAGVVATASVPGGVAVAVCVAVVAASAVRARRERAEASVRDEVPDALRSMGSCFQAGLSLMQTFGRVADEAHGPLGKPFSRGRHVLETGGTASEALACLRGDRSVPELAFVAIALDVQHQTGGSMAHVLDAARDMIEGELELARSLRVQTAQARLSARVVCAMPFVLVAVFSIVSEGFLSPFFESAAGLSLLALAIGMQAAGIVAVRRTLRVGE